jgi:tRNA dimethylallyltransferase
MQKPKVILIGGPTAVGKTKLSIACAKRFHGEIISADCVQIYKHLNIGSAKITKAEKQNVPHHLIDELEPTESFDVEAFRKKAHEKIIELNKQGKLPIIVGGTGFYMRALLFPYTLGSSAKNEAVRQKYEQMGMEHGREFLFEKLKQIDPQTATKLHVNDVKRVIRALEIYEVTGTKKSEQKLDESSSNYDYTLIALTKNRNDLYAKINARVDEMFDEGLLEEVQFLVNEKGLTKNLQSMSGIGYREFFDYFEGKSTLQQVKEQIKQDTRNYAKRQLTYFKTMPQVHWFETDNGIEHILEFLNTKYKQTN